MADLTTLANVRQWVNATGQTATTTDDALLTRLISAVSTLAQSWMDRNILSASYTETYDGTGGTSLLLRQSPVTAVASVTVDGTAIPAQTGGPLAAGYAFDDRRVVLVGYAFRRAMANVVISYTAGYSVVPFDLEQAVIETVVLRYKERDRPGMSSKAGPTGETTAFTIVDFPKSALTTLQQYRRAVAV